MYECKSKGKAATNNIFSFFFNLFMHLSKSKCKMLLIIIDAKIYFMCVWTSDWTTLLTLAVSLPMSLSLIFHSAVFITFSFSDIVLTKIHSFMLAFHSCKSLMKYMLSNN